MTPLFNKHIDDIMSGHFSATMMEDWANDDANLLAWRKATGETAFEKTEAADVVISEQEHFDKGILMVAMVATGIKEESAYYSVAVLCQFTTTPSGCACHPSTGGE